MNSQHYKIVSVTHDWEINITQIIEQLKFNLYMEATGISRIELDVSVLSQLTKDLYKPRSIHSENQRILQAVEGMIVSHTTNPNIFTFVGYLKTPNYFVRTFFHNGLLVSKSYSNLTNDDGGEFEQNDYSVPFNGSIDKKQCHRAYLEEVGCFTTRSRGDYYCIFQYNGKLCAVSKTKLFFLNDINDGMDLYTRKALRFIYYVSGINFDKTLKGECILDHNENTSVLACVRNKMNVFHDEHVSRFDPSSIEPSLYDLLKTIPDIEMYDVHYITSSLQSSFYLNEFKRKDTRLFFNRSELGDQKPVPCSNPLWMKFFNGHGKNSKPETNNGNIMNREYPSLELYMIDLMTSIVMCSEREYIIELLTLESSDMVSVSKRIRSFWEDKCIETFQYQMNWPERYASPGDLTRDLFRNNDTLLSMVVDQSSEENIDSLLVIPELRIKTIKGFISKLNGSKSLVKLVKEKIEKQLSPGEYSYPLNDTSSSARTGRIHIFQHENFFIGTRCNALITKTIEGRLCIVRFLCDKVNASFVVDTSTITITISSTQEKIVKFIHSLVVQREKYGSLDLSKAYNDAVSATSSAMIEHAKNKKKLEDEIELMKHRYLTRVRTGKEMEDRDDAMEEASYLKKELKRVYQERDSRTNIREKEKYQDEIANLETDLTDAIDRIDTYNGVKERSIIDEKEKQLERMVFIDIDKSHPINRVRIPTVLLEKIILCIEYRSDVSITLSEMEEYIKLWSKKTDEFSCSVNTSYGITSEINQPDTNTITVRSSLTDETFNIPSSFNLIPNCDEVDVVKEMEEFNQLNVIEYKNVIPETRMYLLFNEYGMDYHLFKSFTSNIERSSYLLKFYDKLINDTRNFEWLPVKEIDIKENDDDFISYTFDPEAYPITWKTMTSI